MRIAVTTALMVVAAIAWADEPSPADTKTQAAAEQVPATEQATEQATEPATEASAERATEQASEATAADAAKADDKPFKVPAGYRSKRVNGKTLYCSSTVTSGSRVGREKCRTEQQLREIQRQREATTQQTPSNCAGAVCAKN